MLITESQFAIPISNLPKPEPIDSSEFKCPFESGYFINKKDCSLFWQCSHYIAHPGKCSNGLVFNTDINVCDYKSPQCPSYDFNSRFRADSFDSCKQLKN